MTIGGTTSSNALYIVSGGSLTNADAFVGGQTNTVENVATVSGADAEWINTGTLQVGVVGNSNNTVSVSGGGTISASNLVIHSDNDFNLGNDGTLELASGFDVSTNGFNWNDGGHLSIGGDLDGMIATNGAEFLDGGRDLTLDGGVWNTGTNDLVVGLGDSGSVLSVTNGGWVYVGAGIAPTNLGGGVVVASTNGASMLVDNGAFVDVSGGFYIAGTNGSVTVTNGATIKADGLSISGVGGAFNLENDGTLQITGNFDADQAGFNWNDGSTLTVNQALTFTQALDGTNKTLNIDGGSWDRGGNLQVEGAGNTLSILNGGGVTNDAAYVIGSNNTVLVSGLGSDWLNNGTLNITNFGNSVTVVDGGKVTADLLNVAEGNAFNLNKDGTLRMTDDFNLLEHTNLSWSAGGNLSVGGTFSGLTNLTDSRILTLDGGSALWDLSNTNITVGDTSNFGTKLVATNGANIKAANFYVKGYNNAVDIALDSWLLVGDGATTNSLSTGGAMVASTNGAVLDVDNYGSLNIAETLQVGASESATGTVSVANNSTISVGSLNITGTNSAFNLENGGTLEVESSFNASMDGFNWVDGGSLSVGGTLTGLDSLANSNRTLTITGSSGSWSPTETNLVAGYNNRLEIEEGGSVTSLVAVIGASTNDSGNTVFVNGPGSDWTITGDVTVGGEGSNGNTLSVTNQGLVNIGGNFILNSANTLDLTSNGLVSVAGDMTVSNAVVGGSGSVEFSGAASQLSIYGSEISTNVLFDGGGGADTAVAITDGELIVAGSLANRFAGFENLNMTNSLLGGNGTVDVFANINMSGGWIAPERNLVVDGAFFSATNTLLQLTAGMDSLVFTNSSGAQDLSGLLAEITIADTNGFDGTILTADKGWSEGFASTNFIEYFLLHDFELTDDGTNVLVKSKEAKDGEIGAEMDYAGIQGIRTGFSGMQNAAFVRTKQMRRNSVATDHAISNEAYLMSDPDTPTGPQGPGDKNTIFGMHFWAEQFSGQGDYDAMGPSDAYTLNNNGTTFGFDRLFGDSLVVGINYTYARSAAQSDDADQVDTETYWFGLYGEWFSKEDYYLEGLAAFGWSDYETLRIDGLYQGVGSYEGINFGGHIEAGKYFHYNNWAMAPYAGLNYLSVRSDDYEETDLSGGGLPVLVSGQSIDSIESVLGVKLRNRFDTRIGRFQTAGYVEWASDFINDDIGSSLSDTTVSVETAHVAPDENLLNAGIGLSWICTDYLEIGVGYDGRFSDNYEEHTGSAMLDIRF
ncbi:MAG: autotransporter domain-containing protein, partial [Verrucomicrobiota bacterium]